MLGKVSTTYLSITDTNTTRCATSINKRALNYV